MICPNCRTDLVAGSVFCPRCGTRVGRGPGELRALFKRPLGISILAVLSFVGAAGAAVGSGVLVYRAGGEEPGWNAGIAAVLLALAGLNLAVGIGLWRLRRWGRTLELIASWIGLLGFPIGTVVSIVALFYLNRPGIKILFSGKPPSAWTPTEISAVQKVQQMRAAVLAAVMVWAVIALIGILAALAIPLYENVQARARIAKAEADVRLMTSALMLYGHHCGALPPVGGVGTTCVEAPAALVVGEIPAALALSQTNAAGQVLAPLLPSNLRPPAGWTPYRYVVDGRRFRVCAAGDGLTISSDGSQQCPY